MSSPHVIVAAVHEPDGSLEDWWDQNRETLDGFEKTFDHNDNVDWRFCEGEFKSTRAMETFTVKPAYHSHRGEDVIEILLSGKRDMQDIQLTGLEDIMEEINYRFEPDFTLECYYWYTGVDKPGGVPR
jgi:hypothetical protein